MPVPGLGSISAIIHMLAKGPDIERAKSRMRVLGALLVSLLACLSVVRPVSGDMPLSSIGSPGLKPPITCSASAQDFRQSLIIQNHRREKSRKISRGSRAISPASRCGRERKLI